MSANNAVGTGAIVLSTNADAVPPGLKKTEQDVQGWASRVRKHVSFATGGFAVGFLGGLAGGVIPGIHKFLESLPEKTKELAKIGRSSDALGIASDQYIGISENLKKVGVEGEGVNAVFARLAKATAGNNPELAKLGLNAAELAKVPLDKQLLKVSDAIKGMPTATDRANAAMQIFGKSGFQLIPILSQGSEKMQEFINHQKAIGVAVDPAGMKAIQAAAAALPKIKHLMEGAKTQAVVAFAPIVEQLAGAVTEAMHKITPKVQQWGEVLRATLAFVAGEFKVLIKMFPEFEAGGTAALEKIIRMTAQLADVTKAAAAAYLVLTGARFKFLTLEASVTVGSSVAKIPYVGGALAIPAGLLTAYGLEKSGIGGTARNAGDTLFDLGMKMLNDVGGSSKRAEEFLKNYKPYQLKNSLAEAMPPPQTYTAIKGFAPSVLRDSAAAYSLEMRHQFGLDSKGDVPKQQLDEQKKMNQQLGEIKSALRVAGFIRLEQNPIVIKKF